MLTQRAVLLVAALLAVATPCQCEEDAAAQVEAAVREISHAGGSSFHQTDRLASMGQAAIAPLAAILSDARRPDRQRGIAAEALGRIRDDAASKALKAALKDEGLPTDVRPIVEKSCYLQGFTEPVDERIAALVTKHADLPVAATGVRARLAEIYAATGRFRIAAGLVESLVASERAVRPEQAQEYAYNWACYAALGGDRAKAIEAARLALESDRTDLDWMAQDLDLALLQGDETFQGLLAGAKARRGQAQTKDEAWKQQPGYDEYRQVHDGYWNEAFEAWIQANNRYWDAYGAWLETHGLKRGAEAAGAYKKEKGPEAEDPIGVWIPKFQALAEKHAGTPLGAQARGDLLTMYAKARKAADFFEVYLAALREDPNLAVVANHARDAVFLAPDEKRRTEIRDALAVAVAAHPDDRSAAKIRLALAEEAQNHGDREAARIAYAEVARQHPGTHEAKEAEGTLYEMEKLQDGAPAPEFSAADIHGRTWSLSSLRGKVVLLDFWATWCGPCLGELPTMKSVSKQATGEGFVMLGVSFDSDGWTLAEFLDTERIAWPQLCDLRAFDGTLARLYNVHGIPRTVLIDREGKIVHMDLRGEALQAEVQRLLGGAK